MPTRVVHHGEAIAWLASTKLPENSAIVTSLPDVSELTLAFDAWRTWFIDAAAVAMRSVAANAVSIFFQTDIKREGTWVDKSFLVQLGAEAAGAKLLFHKIVCRAPAGTITFGRPAYAHVLCFSRALRLAPSQSSADVLPKLGAMPWKRAMGVAACEAACEFLLAHTACRTVVDPFCGVGTALAVANRYGLDAIGAEISSKRAARARTLVIAA